MAGFHTKLLSAGKHTTPDGVVDASPARVRHWVDQFDRMQRAGIRIPINWGWVPKGSLDTEESYQYHQSCYNAGYVTRLSCSPDGVLWVSGDCAAIEDFDERDRPVFIEKYSDGTIRESVIEEMTAGISSFRDGKGHLWDDAILQVSLTHDSRKYLSCTRRFPLQRLSLSHKRFPMIHLSTLTRLGPGGIDPDRIDWHDLSWADDDDGDRGKVQAISQFLSDRLGIEIDADDVDELVDKLYSMVDDDSLLDTVHGPGNPDTSDMFDSGVPAGGRVEDQPTLLSARRLGMSEREYYARRLTSRDSGGQRRLSTKRKPRQTSDDYAARLTSR